MPTLLNSNMKKIALLAVFVSALPNIAHADLCEKTPAVNLNAISTQQVDNDMVRLNWQMQIQTGSANEAMTAVNTVLDKAIAELSKNKDISKMRNNIQTYPQYGRDRMIQTWQGVGTLTFEMPVQALKNKKTLQIEEGLTLSNLEYFPSEKSVEKVRAGLLQQAMQEFQAKASVVAKGFGKTGYSIGEVSVNDEGRIGQPGPRMFSMASADVMSKGMEIATASGSSDISVSINGRVCLKP